MKAKTTKLCLLFILLCSLPAFYSCTDEAEAFYLYEYWEVMLDPEPPISETSLSITGGTKLGIKGGVAPYTAEIADGQIATAYIDENNDVQISSIKLGSTSLIVKDADGRIIKIGVKVVNGKQSFAVKSVEARITGIDDNDTQQIKEISEKVKEKMGKEIVMRPSGGIIFSFDTKDRGTVKITPSTNPSVSPVQGTFVRSLSESRFSFHVNLDGGETHDFKLQLPERPDNTPKEKGMTTRELGPVSYWLVEDATEKYKAFVIEQLEAKSFDTSSLKIECIYNGSVSH